MADPALPWCWLNEPIPDPPYQGARLEVPPQVLLSSPIDFCYAALPLPRSPSLKLERTKREGELMAFGDRVLYTIKDHFMIPLGLTLATFFDIALRFHQIDNALLG